MILYSTNLIFSFVAYYLVKKYEIRPENSEYTTDEKLATNVWWPALNYDEKGEDPVITTVHTQSILVFTNWFLFILILKGSKFFGVLISIFFSMLLDLV